MQIKSEQIQRGDSLGNYIQLILESMTTKGTGFSSCFIVNRAGQHFLVGIGLRLKIQLVGLILGSWLAIIPHLKRCQVSVMTHFTISEY